VRLLPGGPGVRLDAGPFRRPAAKLRGWAKPVRRRSTKIPERLVVGRESLPRSRVPSPPVHDRPADLRAGPPLFRARSPGLPELLAPGHEASTKLPEGVPSIHGRSTRNREPLALFHATLRLEAHRLVKKWGGLRKKGEGGVKLRRGLPLWGESVPLFGGRLVTSREDVEDVRETLRKSRGRPPKGWRTLVNGLGTAMEKVETLRKFRRRPVNREEARTKLRRAARTPRERHPTLEFRASAAREEGSA
jgi:hypothetical protein